MQRGVTAIKEEDCCLPGGWLFFDGRGEERREGFVLGRRKSKEMGEKVWVFERKRVGAWPFREGMVESSNKRGGKGFGL